MKKFLYQLSSVKKLAGQTLWYGIPSILSRFIGYIMNFTLPIFFSQPSSTADVTQLYAAIPFLNILFTYGLETAYFRFSQEKDKDKLYNTLSISLIASTLLLSSILYFFRLDIANILGVANHPEYINWMIWIVLFDALCTLAFAKLRQENRPKKYAFVRLAGIVANFVVVILFAGILPKYLSTHPTNSLNTIYTRFDKIDFYFIGNICNSIITFLLLFTEFKKRQCSFNFSLWKVVMKYRYPLIMAG